MVRVIDGGAWLFKGREVVEDAAGGGAPAGAELAKRLGPDREAALKAGRAGTITHGILAAHNTGNGEEQLNLKFDSLASHDITFVNIIQTARACGLEKFPLPYVLTNCHNSLCAVGGTINEDDHVFGLSAAEKYGGIYVPPHLAVIHSYVREVMAGGGKMILGSDSHTRYGALGTMGVGEGGGELVKQLLGQTYDINYPQVIGVELTGKVRPGVGPQDVALALIGAVFQNGAVKNAALEFFGSGIGPLSAEFRSGIDVMTTETTCWSSIWETDGVIRDYLALHNRGGDFTALFPADIAYYDKLIRIDLSTVKPMIALPFHPSNVFEIDTLLSEPGDLFRQVEKNAAELIGGGPLGSGGPPGSGGKTTFTLMDKIETDGNGKNRIRVDQGIIAGCAGGTFENIMIAAAILKDPAAARSPWGTGAFSLSIYPGSQPILLELARNGCMSDLISAGAIVRTAFCGPCFGAGDVPANNGFSIRHNTRNFPNREGSRPMDGQIAAVALMDARSIAATAANGGYLASAEDWTPTAASGWALREGAAYHFDDSPYRARVYQGYNAPKGAAELRYGPNITDWPPMEDLGENLLVQIAAFITDPVTTTDELIPSGETSSYRSNPVGLARFTLSRKDPAYVGRARKIAEAETARLLTAKQGADLPRGTLGSFPKVGPLPEMPSLIAEIKKIPGLEDLDIRDIRVGSALYAVKPGDGSAREQAASCQKVLGGWANFAREYATKRYRSNLINWGIVPFTLGKEPEFATGDFVFIPALRSALAEGKNSITAYAIRPLQVSPDTNELIFMVTLFPLAVPVLTPGEKEALLAGSLINLHRKVRG